MDSWWSRRGKVSLLSFLQSVEQSTMARTTDTPQARTPDPADTATADLIRLQTHLNLPPTGQFPTSALAFLQTYLDLVPPSLIHVLSTTTTPRERSRVRGIKARRMVWAGLAGSGGRPGELGAEEGWRRWPLLWERLGGDPRGPSSTIDTSRDAEHATMPFEVSQTQTMRMRDSVRPAPRSTGLFGAMDEDDGSPEPMSNIPLNPLPAQPQPQTQTQKPPTTAAATAPTQTSARLTEESTWPTHSFMPSAPRTSVLQVNRLGSLMRDLEEEREALDVVEARRRERRDQTVAERVEALNGMGTGTGMGDEREVVETFERILLELFLDGKDVSV